VKYSNLHMAIKDFMLISLVTNTHEPFIHASKDSKYNKSIHKYGQRYDTSMSKNCQWKLDNFFYHYAPTSSWVLIRVGANNVHSEESQHLQNG